jgi:hypothetical protein
MDEYTNSATRLLGIIAKLQANMDQLPIAQAWAQVLGLDAEQTREDPDDLHGKLRLIRRELNLAEEQMQATPFSEGIVQTIFGKHKKSCICSES